MEYNFLVHQQTPFNLPDEMRIYSKPKVIINCFLCECLIDISSSIKKCKSENHVYLCVQCPECYAKNIVKCNEI